MPDFTKRGRPELAYDLRLPTVLQSVAMRPHKLSQDSKNCRDHMSQNILYILKDKDSLGVRQRFGCLNNDVLSLPRGWMARSTLWPKLGTPCLRPISSNIIYVTTF